MELTQREQRILESVVAEYVRGAVPVSSQTIESRYALNVSPATIRNDMRLLEEEGFLTQPHTSAGRVPTDKAYRFLVDEFAAEGILPLREKDLFLQDEMRFFAKAMRQAAHLSSALAVSYLASEDLFWKEGWEDVLGEPEFGRTEIRESFVRFLKESEDYLREFREEDLDVFIGNESPFSKVKDFTVMVTSWSMDGKTGVFALFGPKRMSYKKNMSLLKTLQGV